MPYAYIYSLAHLKGEIVMEDLGLIQLLHGWWENNSMQHCAEKMRLEFADLEILGE